MIPKTDSYEASIKIRTNIQNSNTKKPIIALTSNELKGDPTK